MRSHRLWLAAGAVLAVLAGSTPALAAPAEPRDTRTRQEAFDPHPALPGPVKIPGKGVRPAPFTTPLKPTRATALPGSEKTRANALAPDRAAAAGPSLRRVAGADEPSQLYCEEQISQSTSVNADADNYSATTQYLGRLGCNFYLDYAYGVAGIVDRSPSWDGDLLHVGTPFEFYRSYAGASAGGLRIPGDYYDGGRQIEVVFEVYLLAPYGVSWGACNPLPGLRYLLCDGLGTDLLHVVVGTGSFNTGLNPPVHRYTALGDSYSSGTGAFPYLGGADPASCRRSNATYGFDIAGDGFQGLPIDRPNLKACHAARINDIYQAQNPVSESAQLEYVKPYTRFATVTIGGNDLGFGPKLRNCVVSDCSGAPLVTSAELSATQSRLTGVYRDIRSRMRADGYLVVLSYPAFLPNPDDPADPQPSVSRCPATNSQITSAELRLIHQGTAQARDMIANAVAATGDPRVLFVDVFDAFRAHRVCSGDPWSNGVEALDPEDSFHPNARGYQAVGDRLRSALGLG
ncbi:SGNH/GDSL hydrolase family protein [Actinoplanes sp. NPDC048791]|uniref:SGNH/GDSL hydrolase family protein n=1 Tax=Actinoplanes sp. NPDC048791 TaxID=3154623 RepID=UPI003408856A